MKYELFEIPKTVITNVIEEYTDENGETQTREVELEKTLIYYGFRLFVDNDIDFIIFDNDPDSPGTLMDVETATIRAEKRIYDLEHQVPAPIETITETPVETPIVAPIVETPWIMGPVEFLSRFTQDELNTLLMFEELNKQAYSKGVAEGVLSDEIKQLYSFFVMWNKATEVNLKFLPTIQGLTLICTLLGFEENRIKEILSY